MQVYATLRVVNGVTIPRSLHVNYAMESYHPTRKKEPETELIAANSLRQAVKYVERRFDGDFVVHRAECLGIVILLSGSPLD